MIESFLTETGQVVLEWTIRGGVVLLMGGVVVALLRQASASLHHWMWFTLFAALLLLPFGNYLPGLFPALDLDFERRETAGMVSTSNSVLQSNVIQPSLVTPTENLLTGREWQSTLEPSTAAQTPTAATNLVGLFGLFWLIGVLVLLGRVGTEIVQLRKMRKRSCVPVRSRWTNHLISGKTQLGIRRHVRLLVNAEVKTPMTWGVFHPLILIPADAEYWSDERIQMAVLHELKHIQRFDYLSHLVGWFAASLHWVNPLSWVALRRMLIAREKACDDAVITCGIRCTDYAEELVSIARRQIHLLNSNQPRMTMNYTRALRKRIQALLQPDTNRKAASPFAMVSFSLFAIVTLLLVVPAPESASAETVGSTDISSIPGRYYTPDMDDVVESVGRMVRVDVAPADTIGLARKLREMKDRLAEMNTLIRDQDLMLEELASSITNMDFSNLDGSTRTRIDHELSALKNYQEHLRHGLDLKMNELNVVMPENLARVFEERAVAFDRLAEQLERTRDLHPDLNNLNEHLARLKEEYRDMPAVPDLQSHSEHLAEMVKNHSAMNSAEMEAMKRKLELELADSKAMIERMKESLPRPTLNADSMRLVMEKALELAKKNLPSEKEMDDLVARARIASRDLERVHESGSRQLDIVFEEGSRDAGVQVTIETTGRKVIVKSSNGESFVFPNLNPGSYTVRVSAPGYRSLTERVQIGVEGRQPSRISVRLDKE